LEGLRLEHAIVVFGLLVNNASVGASKLAPSC
jgi:hypothetical protein